LDVGERLRTLRVLNKLSQRELAKKAGVTNSTISMIEKNSVSPTLSSLSKVLDGFPISLEVFFNEDKKLCQKVTYSHDELTDVSEGGINIHLIGEAFPKRHMVFLIKAYPSETDADKGLVTNNVEEAGYILSGRIELTVDSETFILNKGDSYYFDKNKPYRFRNRFKEVCKVISASTPILLTKPR